MSGSGHIAGVVNPPDKVKYQYWTKGTRSTDLNEWIATAVETPGSWWPYWTDWLTRHSGGWTIPRTPGRTLGVIEDAPGAYVKSR